MKTENTATRMAAILDLKAKFKRDLDPRGKAAHCGPTACARGTDLGNGNFHRRGKR